MHVKFKHVPLQNPELRTDARTY